MPSHGRTVLTVKQAKFVEQLLLNGGNRSDAYRVAFPGKQSPSSARGAASILCRVPKVAKAIAEGQAAALAAVDAAVTRYQITAERVADELARLAFTRLPQLADVRTELVDGKLRKIVEVRDWTSCDQEALAAVVEVKRSANGEVSIKLADKRAALMDIARLKGWIADKPVDNKQLVMLKIER